MTTTASHLSQIIQWSICFFLWQYKTSGSWTTLTLKTLLKTWHWTSCLSWTPTKTICLWYERNSDHEAPTLFISTREARLEILLKLIKEKFWPGRDEINLYCLVFFQEAVSLRNTILMTCVYSQDLSKRLINWRTSWVNTWSWNILERWCTP